MVLADLVQEGSDGVEVLAGVRAVARPHILIGAEPGSAWLPDFIERDERGYVLTGAAIDTTRWPLARAPQPFETGVPGVLAAGDVRAGDVKRVAAAAGEGSVTVSMVHRYLEDLANV